MLRDQLLILSGMRNPYSRQEAILAAFGFRNGRARRAPAVKLRYPSPADRKMARRMILRGLQKHRIEAWFNRRGIRMTRNMLSRMYGARK